MFDTIKRFDAFDLMTFSDVFRRYSKTSDMK